MLRRAADVKYLWCLGAWLTGGLAGSALVARVTGEGALSCTYPIKQQL